MPRPSREVAALCAIAAAAALFAWLQRYACDDAFITFRYARHLVEGHGLVYNLGEPPVEGYTNFLWTLLVALAIRVGLDPSVFASFVNAWVLLPASLVLVHRLSARVCDDPRTRCAVVAVLALDLAWMRAFTGGLETGLATTLVLGAVASFTAGRIAAFSLLAAAAALTRPDTVVLLTPLAVVQAARTPRRMASLVLPAALLLGPYVAWKVSYYGALVPNTALAKANTPFVATGIWYLVSYFSRNAWLAALVVAGILVWRAQDERARLARLLLVVAAAWCAYIVVIGGDFMEFRLMTACLALGAVALAAGLARWPARASLSALVVVAALNDYDAKPPRVFGAYFVESYAALVGHVRGEPEGWLATGEALREVLPRGSTVRIAVSAAGAIPYESGLFAIDMHGLTDRAVARTPRRATRPGHGRLASWDYLASRDVALVIGHPHYFERAVEPADGVVASLDDLAKLLWHWPLEGGAAVRPQGLVSIPVAPGKHLLAVYLRPHPEVDALIEDGRIAAVPLSFAPREAAPKALHPLAPPFGLAVVWRSIVAEIGWSLLDTGHAPLALTAFAVTRGYPGPPGSEAEAIFGAMALGRGRALRAVGRRSEAADVLEEGASLVRNRAGLLLELARVEAEDGRCASAMRHVRVAGWRRPAPLSVRVAVARCLTQAGSERVLL